MTEDNSRAVTSLMDDYCSLSLLTSWVSSFSLELGILLMYSHGQAQL